MLSRTENPLPPITFRRNLLNVPVDGVTVKTLIYAGAQVSVMNSDLRCRLKKVLTLAEPLVVHVADGRAMTVLGMCSARLTIADHQMSVLFTAVESCL